MNDGLHRPSSKLSDLRDALRRWVEEHIPNLERAGQGSTLWFGVMQKCADQVDELLFDCARVLLAPLGAEGGSAVQGAGKGKPFERLTFGECTKLLQSLEAPLTRALHGESRAGDLNVPLFQKRSVRLLDRLSRLRNDFVHGGWRSQRSDELTAEFLRSARALCDEPFVRLAIELERAA